MIVTFFWSNQVFKGLFIKTTSMVFGNYTYYTHYFKTNFGEFNLISSAKEIKPMSVHDKVKVLDVTKL